MELSWNSDGLEFVIEASDTGQQSNSSLARRAMWSKKAASSAKKQGGEEEDDKRLYRADVRAVEASSSTSSLQSHAEIPLPQQYRQQQQQQQQPQHASINHAHAAFHHGATNTTALPRPLTPTPSSTSETTDTVTSSDVSKLLHPSYYDATSLSHPHHHHHHHHPNNNNDGDGDPQQQQGVSPTPFRPMPPREFSLGSNLRRLYPTMPLPTTFPADTTTTTTTTTNSTTPSGGSSGGVHKTTATARPRNEKAGASTSAAVAGRGVNNKHKYGTRNNNTIGGDDGNHNVMGCISETKDTNDLSVRSNIHSLGSSHSEFSVSLSILDDGGLRRSRRSSMNEDDGNNAISRSPPPLPLPPRRPTTSSATAAATTTTTIPRRISDDLVAKSSMALLVESSMSLSVYEREIIEEEAARRESEVLSGRRSGGVVGSRRPRSSIDKLLPPPPMPPPLLDASSKHNASSGTSLVSSTGSKSHRISHESSANGRKRGRLNNELHPYSPEKHRPLAVNTVFDTMRAVGNLSNGKGDGPIPESIIGDTSTPMSMSTISYHGGGGGGNDDNAAAATATARFGRLLQECRKLTETIGDDTILSNNTSSGINSSNSVGNRGGSLATTPVSDTLKLRQLLEGSAAGLPSNASRPPSDSGLNNYLTLGSTASKQPLLQRGSINESVLSDLSVGVDVMYGEVDGDVNKSNTAMETDDETASFDPNLLAHVISNTKGGVGGIRHNMAAENAVKRHSTEEKKDEMKVTTAHGGEFRPREEDAHSRNVNSKEGKGGDYSWLSYTTKEDNVTPKHEQVKTKTSPLENDELRIQNTTKSSTVSSNYSTDFSEDSGGLLVGFGHRKKVVGSEASSISSSDSSNSFSSDSGNSSSDGSGSSGTSSSYTSSSDSESNESPGLPAIARHGLQIPASADDSQDDIVSALSFGGASTLMALQALKGSISSPSSPGVVEGRAQFPRRSPPGSKNLVETEYNTRTNSDGAVLESERGTHNSDGIPRQKSIDAYSGLDKLDEVSESNASFPDDILANETSNNSIQRHFPEPSPSKGTSAHAGVEKSASISPKSSKLSLLPLAKVSYSASSAKPPSPFFPDGGEIISSTTGHEIPDSSSNHQTSHSSRMPQQKATSYSSDVASPLANSYTNLSKGTNSSKIGSRAAVGKSHHKDEPLSGRSLTSRSSATSYGQMQRVLSTEGGRQDAGITTIESGRSVSSGSRAKIDEKFQHSAFVRAEARNPIVAVHEFTYNEGDHTQMKYQGSGESPLENIKSNINDDLSSMSSVVSRARNSSTRPAPAVASQTKGLNALNDSSKITAQELYEDFPDELRENLGSSGSFDTKSDVVIGNVDSNDLECNTALSATDRVSADGQRKHFPFDMRSMRSGDENNFIGDELYEDFPNMVHDGDMIVFQRNQQVLPTDEETDWKKPWNTSSKKPSLDASSTHGSDVNIKSKSGSERIASGQDREMQRSVDERSNDGSMALFESKQALENMGLYAAEPELDGLETPAFEEERHVYRKRVSRTSDASSSITEWDFTGSRETGALMNESNDDAKELPPSSSKLGLPHLSQSFEELELRESSQLEVGSSNLKAEGDFVHENANFRLKSSSARTFASTSKQMSEMLRSSKLLRMQRQPKNDESFGDESSSYCLSEKSTRSDVQSPQSLHERFPMETVVSTPFDSDEDEVGVGEDRSQNSMNDDESSQSAKSLGGAFNESGNSMSLHMQRKEEPIVDEDSSDDEKSDEESQDHCLSSKLFSIQRCKCQKSTILLLVALLVPILVVSIIAGVVTKQLKKSSNNDSPISSNKPAPSPTNVPTQPPVNVLPDWTQVGGDLVGGSSGDESGFAISVSEDGSRAIVGARRNAREGLRNRGSALVYQYDANLNSFVPIWDFVGEAAGDQCGYSVSIARNGTRIAVGCIGSDDNGNNSGKVLVFDEDKLSNSWKLVHEMVGEGEFSLFGVSVSFSQDGNKIIVGAPYHSESAELVKSGRAYVYAEVNNAEWMQLGGPMLGGSSNELFGWSVSFSPTAPFVAVGAPLLEGSSGSGYVEVYAFQDNGWHAYGEQMMLGVSGDRFGFSVSLAGDNTYQRVAIGAPGMSMNGEGSGLVSVYESDAVGWQRTGDDLLGDGVGDNLGYAVAMTSNGNRMSVGVPNMKVQGVTVGQVKVVDILSDGILSAGAISGRDGENFGASVSVSSDGRLIFGGSPKTNLSRVYGDIYYQRS